MKKILFILVMIITFNANSQVDSCLICNKNNDKIVKVANYKLSQRDIEYGYYICTQKFEKNYSPGYELRKASNHFYTGVICSFSGALIMVGGSFIDPKETFTQQFVQIGYDKYGNPKYENQKISDYDYTGRYVVMGCGAALSLVGIIYGIESFSHIYKAGIKLDKQTKNETGLYINNSNSNMTLTYRF